MKRDRHNDRDRPGTDPATWVPALFVLAVLTFAVVGAGTVMQSGAFRPGVGDIVVFRPDHHASDMWRATVPATVVTPLDQPFRTCALNSTVMISAGGSLIVEARYDDGTALYRLHWAGGRTAADGRDCGSSAELMVSRVDLRKLATAAGGFGVRQAGFFR